MTPPDDADTAAWRPFARRVEERRAELGLAKTELADALGLSTAAMRKWRRDTDPSADTVSRAAEVLRCLPEDLWPGWDEGGRPGRVRSPQTSLVELRLQAIEAELATQRAALELAGLIEPAPEVQAIDAFGAAAQPGGDEENDAARRARGEDHWTAEARLQTAEERRRRLDARLRVDADDPTRKWIEGRRGPAGSGDAAADAADAIGDAADVSREQHDGTAQPPERKKPSHGA